MVSSAARFGVQDRQLTSAERWVCFAALFFLGFTATFNQFKAAPAIQFIGSDLGMGVEMLSQIMGVFSIAGMLLAYPGMLVMQRFGIKFSITVTAIIQLIGSVICVFSSSTPMFLFGRTLEGVAYGLICVIGPNIMPRLFPLKDQGLCMGIWSQWTPAGSVGLRGASVPTGTRAIVPVLVPKTKKTDLVLAMLLATGHAATPIAEKLCLSVSTVKSRIYNIREDWHSFAERVG